MKDKYDSPRKSSRPVDPRIEWLRAMLRDDHPGAYLTLAEVHRDPKRWFASAFESGIPRIWARGNSEAEVRTKLELAVADRAFSKSQYRIPGDWEVIVHPPDSDGDAEDWIDWPADGAVS